MCVTFLGRVSWCCIIATAAILLANGWLSSLIRWMILWISHEQLGVDMYLFFIFINLQHTILRQPDKRRGVEFVLKCTNHHPSAPPAPSPLTIGVEGASIYRSARLGASYEPRTKHAWRLCAALIRQRGRVGSRKGCSSHHAGASPCAGLERVCGSALQTLCRSNQYRAPNLWLPSLVAPCGI